MMRSVRQLPVNDLVLFEAVAPEGNWPHHTPGQFSILESTLAGGA
jgi:hypothetical protein